MPRVSLVALVSILVASPASAQAVLKSEPPMGALRQGERVLVDDGSCPKGQIQEVIGGNHVEAGGTLRIRRVRRCIARTADRAPPPSGRERTTASSNRVKMPSPKSGPSNSEPSASHSGGM
jgi:hypothetical protein